MDHKFLAERQKVCNWFQYFARFYYQWQSFIPFSRLPVRVFLFPYTHSVPWTRTRERGPVLSAFVLLPTSEPETEISHFSTFPPRALSHTDKHSGGGSVCVRDTFWSLCEIIL